MLCILDLFTSIENAQSSQKMAAQATNRRSLHAKRRTKTKQILFQLQMSKNCFFKNRNDLFVKLPEKCFSEFEIFNFQDFSKILGSQKPKSRAEI